MVLEQIFKTAWLEKKQHAFILGFLFTLVGLVSANLIFPSNVGLMSIAFTSILLIPSLAMLLKLEENVEIREKKLSIHKLFKDHKDIFKVYVYLFLGIFLAYSLISLIIPEEYIGKLFASQLHSASVSGFAILGGRLGEIILNNLIVFGVCFILSMVYGAGSIIFLTWNASVWGVVFAFFVKQSALAVNQNIFVAFGKLILPFLPHMTTEALAYISAAIVGGVVSKAVLREKLFSKKFYHIITDALIFLVIGFLLVITAGVIEVRFYA